MAPHFKRKKIVSAVFMATTTLALQAPVYAQSSPSASPDDAKKLGTVVVKDRVETQTGKDSLRVTKTTIGKGNQELRDIPQSVTVVTEKLIDDRNLDTLKDVLKNTAGVTFMAAEGGEEDIRLRGFSLAQSGDIYVDGMRDPAFYERDTFNDDRIELLRGSASMLFGRGSTGGVVNQVNKLPQLFDQNEATLTFGNYKYLRAVVDSNFVAGEDAAFRISAMSTKADNSGNGSRIEKLGVAPSFSWGIGTANEFLVSAYYLDNRNGINYGLPWIRPNANSPTSDQTINKQIDPDAYYGMASDYNHGTATYGTFSYLHRFDGGDEIKTIIRKGRYTRDQRASAIRSNNYFENNFSNATVFTRGNNNKIQDLDTLYAQTDYNGKFEAWGFKHAVLAGFDYAKEDKNVYAANPPTGVTLTKANTTAGTPDDGATVDESRRIKTISSTFNARAYGAYAQDMIQITPYWKILGGLRYDNLDGHYYTFNTSGANTNAYKQSIGNWSKRVGALYQPSDLSSYYFSYGTSFNTSGDTYSYSALSANTPPEKSENIELGAKLDTADKRFTTRVAVFRATKYNERNTDPDTAASAFLLSGKRHAAGFELDLTGRLTDKWEVFGSYTWIPIAKVDVAAPTATTFGNRQGDRPGLTPRYSGTIWSTYQLTQKFRAGGGLNYRAKQSPADAAAEYYAPSFVTADLMAEYIIDNHFTVKANASNITNKLYGDSLYRGHYIPGAGRIVQVSLSALF
jgi:catecholate siderophore receptor